MTWDELWSMDSPTDGVRVLAAVLLAIVSVAGTVLNSVVTVSLLVRVKKKDGFLKICCTKSFGNNIVCIGYLVWPVPVTFLNSYFLPHMFNAFMGQLVGWFGWSISPLSQVLLIANRVLAVFFPHLYHRTYRFAPSSIGITVCLIMAFLMFAAFFPETCHYLYDVETIGWLPEESVCTAVRRQIFIISMIILVLVTSVLGTAIFLKLVADSYQKSVMMTTTQSTTRRSKNQRILFQTLIQNALILADTLNTTVTYKLFPVVFFEFLTLSFSMVFLRALEGLVMVLLNDRIYKGTRTLFGLKSEDLQSIRGVPKSTVFWNNASTTTK